MPLEKNFWQKKNLTDMNNEEWEALCDGCGQCCLHKLDDGGEMVFTNIACHLLDNKTGGCRHYAKRATLVHDCVQLTAKKVPTIDWLPTTCAYRLVHEKKDLYPWHHLISGNRDTVHQAGMSVRGKIVSEKKINEPLLMAMERPEHQLRRELRKQVPTIQKIFGRLAG
ncbi:MAG: YcgN family cysteine cluster protein [Alphaproteobacteria bacterium]|nr:YcgN family cysteine cluster protein [Alphaproteobacteria bacterium]